MVVAATCHRCGGLALLNALTTLGVVMVPVALALMLTALFVPAVDFLDRHGAPRGGAVALVLICGLAAVGGILAFVIAQFADGLPQLIDQLAKASTAPGAG